MNRFSNPLLRHFWLPKRFTFISVTFSPFLELGNLLPPEKFWIFAPNNDVTNQNKTTWKTEEKLWSNWSYWNLWSFIVIWKMKSEWKTIGLSKAVLQTLKKLKFSKMTPVQVRTCETERYKMNLWNWGLLWCFNFPHWLLEPGLELALIQNGKWCSKLDSQCENHEILLWNWLSRNLNESFVKSTFMYVHT